MAVAVSSGFIACAGTRGPVARVQSCAPYASVAAGGAHGVVFPADAGWVEGRRPGEVTRYWTPSLDDLEQLEGHLGQCFAVAGLNPGVRLGSYARQYVGFYLDGRKMIFVNLFNSIAGFPDWRCKPVVFDDAGDSLLHLEYDLEADRCQMVYNGWVYVSARSNNRMNPSAGGGRAADSSSRSPAAGYAGR